MKKICCYPFYHAEIDFDGDVFCCCPDFTDFYCLGNIFQKSFEEIWFGEKWKKFREDIIKNKYEHCNLEICKGLDKNQFTNQQEILNEYKKQFFPKHITLSIDSICNVQCIMCRNQNLPLNFQEKKRLNDKFDDFIYMMKDAELVTLDGCGEVFASVFHKKLIKEAIKKYPKLKFDIFTNGLVCNEKTLKEFSLYEKLNAVTVSLHAGCETTYNKIVKNSNWEKVLFNIKYLSKLQEEKKIKELSLTFVLSSLNFKDLPDFIKIAQKNNAKINIWPIRPFNDCRVCNNIQKYDITNKTHPRHLELLEILKNPILKDKNLLINEQITNLLKEKA